MTQFTDYAKPVDFEVEPRRPKHICQYTRDRGWSNPSQIKAGIKNNNYL